MVTWGKKRFIGKDEKGEKRKLHHKWGKPPWTRIVLGYFGFWFLPIRLRSMGEKMNKKNSMRNIYPCILFVNNFRPKSRI